MRRLSRAFFRTTVARLALIYIVVFAVTTALLFGSVYVLTLRAVDNGTENLMESQLQGLSEQYATLGLRGLVATIRERSQSLDRSRSVYLLADESLQPLVGNLAAWPQLNTQRGKWFEFNVTVSTQDGRVEQHPIRAALVTLPEGYRLLIGTDVIERARLATVMQRLGVLALVLLVLMGAGIGVWMNRRLLHQVHAIAAAGQDIANGDFARRLPVRGSGDELDELATNLNTLLERIEQLTLALRFVIDGTAHDLRGPLNRLRMRLEQAMAQAPSGREPLEAAMQDADALLRTLEALLRIAQAQSGAANAEMAALRLDKLATEIAELYAPLAEQGGIKLELERMDAATVQGSRQLLAHAIANLLDNAVKYTPAGGRIAVAVSADGLDDAEAVVLKVQDNGPGIPAADRERVLQRFVRLDSAQAEPGTGLGLSLVAAVCRFHHASLRMEDAQPGLLVRLTFRRAREQPDGDAGTT